MTWKEVDNSDAGDADHFGGNDLDKVSKLFKGVDVDDVKIGSDFAFLNGKLQIRNPADTFQYNFVPSAIAADRNITLPLLTGTDTLAVLSLAQTLSNKTLDSSCSLANDLVTYAMMQNVSAGSKLLGRGDSGSGDTQEITVGSGLTMTGTTLSSTAGSPTDAQYVTLATNGTLSAERVLTAGDGISLTDAGAGSTVTAAQDYIDLARKRISFVEDCFSDPTTHSAIFDTVVSGTGAQVTATANTQTGKFGLWTLDTGTTTTGVAVLVGGNVQSFTCGQGTITIEFLVKFPTLSTSGQEYVFRSGLRDTSTGGATNSITFRYDRLNNGDFWAITTQDNAAISTSTSNTAIAADTWYRCKYIVNAGATSVNAYVNGTELNISPVSTNIPGNTRYLTFCIQLVKSAGTTARTAVLDYYAADIDLTSAR